MGDRRRPVRLRLGTLVIGAVLGLVAVVLPAFGDTPESGQDPRVTLTVVPDLLSGPTSDVTVTGSGFPPNTAGVLRQCTANLTGQMCDETLVVAFTTTSSGNIPPTTVTVKRVIDPAGPSTFNCSIQVCALVARAGNAVSQHQIRFAGAGTVPPTSTSTTSTSTTSTSTTSTSTTSTSTTSTSTPSTSTTSTSTTSTTVPTGLTTVCPILRALATAFPFLAPILGNVAVALGCPVTG